MNADVRSTHYSTPVSASTVPGVIPQYELRTAVSMWYIRLICLCERILAITLTSPQGEKYHEHHEHARKKGLGIDSTVCLACPPELPSLKDQYFNTQDHPV